LEKKSCKHNLKRDDLTIASQRRSHRMRQKKNLKTFLSLLLFEIEELQKKNFTMLKIKKQLTSQILN